MSVTTAHEGITGSAIETELTDEVYEWDRSIGRQSEKSGVRRRYTPRFPPTNASGQVDDTYDEGTKPTKMIHVSEARYERLQDVGDTYDEGVKQMKMTHVSEARYERVQDTIAEGSWQRGPSQSQRMEIEEELEGFACW